MNCPACQAENRSEAITCATCGRSLRANADQPARRSGSRRRNNNNDAAEAAVTDTNNPAAWRAYRVALWSVVPGLGLLLGPLATVLGYLAVRKAGDDLSASNRAKAAILIGAGSALTQWLGVTLIYFSR
jgi:polyferredoxin